MSADAISTIIIAAVTLLGAVAASVLWVRNSMSALRREMHEQMQTELREVEQRMLARIDQERERADRIYASQTAVAEVAQQIRGMSEALSDVRRTVHEMWSEMQKQGRRRSHTPSGGQ